MSEVTGYKIKHKKGHMTGNYRFVYEESVCINFYNRINNGIYDKIIKDKHTATQFNVSSHIIEIGDNIPSETNHLKDWSS